MLCDGPSPENIASTVVDCTKIETGHIGFFRVGLIPKSKVTFLVVLFILETQFQFSECLCENCCLCFCDLKVLQIFEDVQKRHIGGQINPAFENDLHPSDTQRDASSREDETVESGSENSAISTVSPEQSPDLGNGS